MLAIVTAAVLGFVIPVSEVAASGISRVIDVLISFLFVSYGARIDPSSVRSSLRNWRLQLGIIAVTFIMYPAIGWGLSALLSTLLPAAIIAGILFTTVVPSTVQSAVTLTAVARGNVPAAIVSASLSNVLGVVLTPLLAVWLLGSASGSASASSVNPASFLSVIVYIALPFAVGQALRRWIAKPLRAHGHAMSLIERGTIAAVVFEAVSTGRREGVWAQVSTTNLLAVIAIMVVLVTVMLGLIWVLGAGLRFSRPDRITLLFCGNQKSLTTGAAMASILFPELAGALVLPLIVFHQAQLIVGAQVAQRLGSNQSSPEVVTPTTDNTES